MGTEKLHRYVGSDRSTGENARRYRHYGDPKDEMDVVDGTSSVVVGVDIFGIFGCRRDSPRSLESVVDQLCNPIKGTTEERRRKSSLRKGKGS